MSSYTAESMNKPAEQMITKKKKKKTRSPNVMQMSVGDLG